MIRTHALLPDGTVLQDGGVRLCEAPPPGALVWVDLAAPTEAERALLSERWHFHPLAIEDCVNPQRRAKYERYANHSFVVLLALEHDTLAALDTVGLRVFVRHDLIVTVHPKALPSVERVSQHLYDAGRGIGAGRLLHALVDAVIDEYLPVLEDFEERLDALELQAARPVHDPAVVAQLLAIRHDLLTMRRMFLPHEEVVRRLMDSADTSDETRIYLRDVLDHLMVVGDTVTNLLDLATGAMQVHANATNERLNQVMKYLAVISTIMLPWTVVSGIFGMNFDVLPIAHHQYGFITAVAIMATTTLGLLGWFRYRGWL